MPAQLTQYIEDFDNISDYDWCGYILEMLLTQITSTKNLKVGGCVMILPFWLCEHTHLIKPVNDTAFPRFLKWDLKELRRCVSNIDIGEHNRKFGHNQELKPSKIECQAFANLHRYWSIMHDENNPDSQSTVKESGTFQTDSQATENVCVSFQHNEDVYQKDESSDEFVEDTYPIATPREVGSDVDFPNHNRSCLENKTSTSKNQGSNPEVESEKDPSIGMGKNKDAIVDYASKETPLFSQKNSEFSTPCKVDGNISVPDASRNLQRTDESVMNDGDNLGGACVIASKSEGGAVAKLNQCLKSLLEKDCEIERLKKMIDGFSKEKEVAVIEARAATNIQKDKEIEKLKKQVSDLRVAVSVFEEEKEKVCAVYNSKMDRILDLETEIELLKKEDFKREAEELNRVVETLKLENASFSVDMDKKVAILDEKTQIILDMEKEVEHWMTTANQWKITMKKELSEKMKEHVDSKWDVKLEGMKDLHKKEILKMESDNALLKSEIDILRMQLQGLTAPTPTQILENPDTLARVDAIEELHITKLENLQLVKMNENLVDTIQMNEEIDNFDESGEGFVTPCLKKRKGKAVVQEPTTLVKRVKGRTTRNDRKNIEITPQPDTIELLDLVGEDAPKIKRGRRTQKARFRMNTKFVAARKTSERNKGILKDYLKEQDQHAHIWEGVNTLCFVTYNDAISLLHHEVVSDRVIDSWVDILRQKMPQRQDGRNVVVFTSKCWDMFATPHKFTSSTLATFIEQPLHNVGATDLVLFPIMTKSDKDVTGNHWTLLTLDLVKCEWKFFNSNLPRRRDGVDIHLTRSYVVVDYVDSLLRSKFSTTDPDHKLLKGELKRPVSIHCIQQSSGSSDCDTRASHYYSLANIFSCIACILYDLCDICDFA